MFRKIWNYIEHNRFTVIAPLVALMLWVTAIGCTPETQSPVTGRMVNAQQLAIEYDHFVAQFDYAKADLERKAEAQAEFKKALLELASGGVADLPGLLKMLLSGGLIGFAVDNVRKNGVIGGLKKNV